MRLPPLYHSKLGHNSLLLVKLFIGDGEFLYFHYWVCGCVLFKSSRFVKFSPINGFSAQVTIVWVWCFTWTWG